MITLLDERIDIDSWAPDTIARWVQVQTVGFIQEWRIPINEEEMQVVAEGLVKELTGFGPLDDLLLFHLTSSILNLLAWWLRNPERVDAETMAEIIERTVLTPVGGLRRQPPEGFGEGPG